MNKLVSIFVFSAALFGGAFSVSPNNPTIYERIYPLFSREEADSMLGKRIRNKFYSEQLAEMKYPLNAEENFIAEKVQIGETGQIIALQELDGGYILLVKWDKQNHYGRDMFSYDNRFSCRLFSELE